MRTSWLDQHFILAVVITFLVLFITLMGREWLSLRQEGIYDIEWHTTSMTALLHRDLEHHHPLSEILSRLDEPELFTELDMHVRQKIGHLGLLKLKIYDRNGTIIYADNPALEGRQIEDEEIFLSVLKGATESRYISAEEYRTEYGFAAEKDMAEVYVPVDPLSENSARFVLEAYYDYTPILARGRRLLLSSALSLFVSLSVCLGLLAWLYRSRQRLSIKVEQLESILPICMHCKKIRLGGTNKPDTWVDMESYFSEKEAVSFSHGICEECRDKHYPEVKRRPHP